MCSLSSFARKGSKRCRWGDIRFGHDESSHSAPWRPLGMGVMGVDPLMIGRQEDRYIHPLTKVLKMKHESVQNEPQHFPFVLTFLHSSRICYLNLTHFLSLQSIFTILRRWSLDGVPETVLGGTFGGGYDQLKFPRGIVLQGGSALVWFVWSSHNENQLIIDN